MTDGIDGKITAERMNDGNYVAAKLILYYTHAMKTDNN
jgi:hypothetical protein